LSSLGKVFDLSIRDDLVDLIGKDKALPEARFALQFFMALLCADVL